jgi:hypothetical protein
MEASVGALFDRWTKGFDAWESRAAKISSEVLESPRVLEPSGALLSSVLRGKARANRALQGVWTAVGLPNRRDQERTLHLLTVMERRILDLEEKLEDAHEELRRERRKS